MYTHKELFVRPILDEHMRYLIACCITYRVVPAIISLYHDELRFPKKNMGST